jgi:hypothetical protein
MEIIYPPYPDKRPRATSADAVGSESLWMEHCFVTYPTPSTKPDFWFMRIRVIPRRRTKAGLVLVYTDGKIPVGDFPIRDRMNHREGKLYRHSVPLWTLMKAQ